MGVKITKSTLQNAFKNSLFWSIDFAFSPKALGMLFLHGNLHVCKTFNNVCRKKKIFLNWFTFFIYYS